MLTNELLNSCRGIGDPLADEVVAHYFSNDKTVLRELLSGLSYNTDVLGKDVHDSLLKFKEEVYKPLTEEQLICVENGQRVFAKNASDIMLMLGFLSLPYCYAAAKGAEVLFRSKRILDNPAQRLMETAEFIFDVTEPGAFGSRGRGFVSLLKVRLIHASIRWHLTQKGLWDSSHYGIPINQEDMAGTNLSFSLIPVRGLRKLGINISPKDAESYIAFWSLMGDRLGLVDDLLPWNNKNAYLLEKKIRERHFVKSDAGVKLTKSLLQYFEVMTMDSPMEGKSKMFVQFLLGEKVSEVLGLRTDHYSRLSFRPFHELMRLKNMLIKNDDNYLAAYYRFVKHQKKVTAQNSSLSLPRSENF